MGTVPMLSLKTKMDFFGKVTKPYNNKGKPADPENGKFCTLPVKMSFKDKTSKARAETVLRSLCKVQCSTPYPPRLRQVIKKTLGEQKLAHPNDFVQVKVDTDNFCLKVSRKTNGKWFNNVDTVPLPDDVIEMGKVTNAAERMDTVQDQAENETL